MKKKILVTAIVFCSMISMQSITYADKYVDTPVYGLDGTLIEGSKEDIIDNTKVNVTAKQPTRENIRNSKQVYLDYKLVTDKNEIEKIIANKNITAINYKDMKITYALSDKAISNIDMASIPSYNIISKKINTLPKDKKAYTTLNIFNDYVDFYNSIVNKDSYNTPQATLNKYYETVNSIFNKSAEEIVPHGLTGKIVKYNHTVFEKNIINKIVNDMISISNEYTLPFATEESINNKLKTDINSINKKAKELFNITLPVTSDSLSEINRLNIQFAFDLYDLYKKENKQEILGNVNKIISNTLIINNYYK